MEEGLGESLIDSEAKLLRSGSSDMMSQRSCSKSSPTKTVVVLSTLVAVCGSLCYGCASGYSSPSESGIMEDLDLSVAAFSVFASIMTVGGMIGAVLSGKIADIFGRRSAMWFSDLFCIFGWLAIAFTKDALWLDLGRLSIGFGIGIISYVVPVYIAEIAPKDLRGVFTATNQLMSTCGFVLAFLIGNVISWRPLALLGAIPCMIQLVSLFFIPESPRWLLKIGREKEFENALQRLRGKNADCSEEAADIRDRLEVSQQLSEAGFLDLFQKKYANALIIGVGLMLLQQFGGASATAYYASSIFEKADVSSKFGTTAAAAVQIPAVILGVLLMDKAGRRPLLLISAIGMFFTYILMGVAFLLQADQHLKEFTPILLLIGFLGSCVAYCIGIAGIPWVIMSEIFPLNIKASAGSLVTLVNWSCTWIATYTFNFMMGWSSAGTFFVFASVYAVTIVFVAKLVPETKGLTLEEIQVSITSRAFLQ